ncbi:MAG: hypothetical protein EOP64_05105 [Sphingomonas sp.]|nr:MAG: hypothetical protein EOP64_05105 [Sphingomonas sp.]
MRQAFNRKSRIQNPHRLKSYSASRAHNGPVKKSKNILINHGSNVLVTLGIRNTFAICGWVCVVLAKHGVGYDSSGPNNRVGAEHGDQRQALFEDKTISTSSGYDRVTAGLDWRWPIVVVALAATAIVLGWVGYAASDDAAYYLAAQHWIVSPPFPGYDHWATRFPLVITLAATLRVLGENETALTVVALLWYVVFLLVMFALATRIGGRRVGWIATILLSTMPVVVSNATTVSCDLVEATFLVLGILWAGDAATQDLGRDLGRNTGQPAGSDRHALAAGLAFGIAILCRETTTLALMGFVPLFVLGKPISRRALILMAVSCFALLAGEAVFQWVLTGNPLNRWDVAFHHDAHIDRAANAEGNFLVHPVLDPLVVLLVNNDFGMIFWIFLLAAWLRVDRLLDAGARRRTIVLAALALAMFVLTGVLYTKLVLNPRYFMLPAIAAAIIASVWLGSATVRVRTAVLVVAIAVNFLMLSVENTHPRWAAEALVIAARERPDRPIVTDAQTYHRALMPLHWHHLTRIERGPPRPGQLFLLPTEEVPTGATILARYPSPSTPLGAILDVVGLAGFIPPAIRHRLISPNPTALLIRM